MTGDVRKLEDDTKHNNAMDVGNVHATDAHYYYAGDWVKAKVA